MRSLALGMLVLVFASCAPALEQDARQLKPEIREPIDPTIVVHNVGIDRLVVYDERGQALGRVMVGEARCINLRGVGELSTQLIILIEGKYYATPMFSPHDFDGGWLLKIGTTPRYDVLSLQPLGKCVQRR